MLGAIIGDIVGSVYEWNNIKTKDFPLFRDDCFFTDDTVMTIEEKSEKPSVRQQIQEIKERRADETKKMPERSKSQEPKRHQNVKKKKSKGR